MTAFVESPYSKNLPNRFPPKQKPLVGPTGRSSPSWPRLHATEPRAVEFAVVVAHGVRHTVFVGNPARKREQIVLKLAHHPTLIVHRRSVCWLVGRPVYETSHSSVLISPARPDMTRSRLLMFLLFHTSLFLYAGGCQTASICEEKRNQK